MSSLGLVSVKFLSDLGHSIADVLSLVSGSDGKGCGGESELECKNYIKEVVWILDWFIAYGRHAARPVCYI